ncbi:MAG: ATP-dependent DNA ligase, partial [Patescibacteria group bacterium]
AYHVRPDLGYIGKLIKEKGIEAIHKVKPAVFTPIIMMRAERLSSSEAIIEKLGKCVMEPKYDGFRLQVHYSKKNKDVRLYSRNLEEVSEMYPDVIEGVLKEVKADELIIEGEAIGYDATTDKLLPFQQTVQRKRKYDIAEKAKEIPLKLFVFELLYVDGENLLQVPFSERRKKLEKAVKPAATAAKDTILLAPDTTTDDPKTLDILFEDALTEGLEGMIVKKLDGIYQPGARGFNWIKFKKSYGSNVNDTIDCLVMGYDFGKGKRADFGIGAFLVGVYDEKRDLFVTVAKIGTGLSDDEWRELQKRCQKFKTDSKPALYEVDKMMGVDIWVKPEIVVEIRADIITRSSVHTAGRVMKPSKSGSAFDVETPGYALRFPRLEKFRDKKPEDSTTVKEMETLFRQQR